MGFRFRKSFKVMPGVRLNVSKSGFSTTVGGRGASLNLSKRGVYVNASIPGTGLGMREKIAGGKPRSTKSTKAALQAAQAIPEPVLQPVMQPIPMIATGPSMPLQPRRRSLIGRIFRVLGLVVLTLVGLFVALVIYVAFNI